MTKRGGGEERKEGKKGRRKEKKNPGTLIHILKCNVHSFTIILAFLKILPKSSLDIKIFLSKKIRHEKCQCLGRSDGSAGKSNCWESLVT